MLIMTRRYNTTTNLHNNRMRKIKIRLIINYRALHIIKGVTTKSKECQTTNSTLTSKFTNNHSQATTLPLIKTNPATWLLAKTNILLPLPNQFHWHKQKRSQAINSISIVILQAFKRLNNNPKYLAGFTSDRRDKSYKNQIWPVSWRIHDSLSLSESRRAVLSRASTRMMPANQSNY